MNTTNEVWNIEEDLHELPYLQSLAATLARLNEKKKQYEEEYVSSCMRAGRRDDATQRDADIRWADQMQRRHRRLDALAALIYDELETAVEWEAKALDPADDKSLASLTSSIWDLAHQAD